MSTKYIARQFRLPQMPAVRVRSELPAAGANGGEFDREQAQREQRALGIAAMGLVNKLGDRYLVAPGISRDRAVNFEVWQMPAGGWRCSCSEFAVRAGADAAFRCEHILAVKHAARTLELRAVNPPAALSAVTAVTGNVGNAVAETQPAASGLAPNKPKPFAGDPCARVFGDLVAPRQLGLIRQLARETQVDAEAECRRVLDCASGDLSKAAAAVFIEHLAALPRHTGEARMALAS